MTKALWFSLTAGLVAWTAHLLLSYLLADLGCVAETDALWLGRHLLTAGAVVAVGATLAAARAGGGQGATPVPVSQAAAGSPSPVRPGAAVQVGERRFLASVALVVNTVFLFGVVLAGSTNFFLTPCA